MKMAHITDKCDFCDQAAVYDGKTAMGPWAFMCQKHFDRYGIKTDGLYKQLQTQVASKECYICHQVKPITDFYPYTDAHGIPRTRNECKQCNLQERKERTFRKVHTK